MSGLKELKRRQKTAMIIQRMTGAMKMIARARYTSAQNEVRKNFGLIEVLQNLAQRISKEMDSIEKMQLEGYAQEGRSDAPWLLVVMTSDSGLCGGFNQKLIKTALEWLSERKNEKFLLLCIGKKGFLGLQKKSSVTILNDSDARISGGIPSNQLMEYVTSLFQKEEIRGCFILYSKFFNILKQEPHILQILPTPWMHSSNEDNTVVAHEHISSETDLNKRSSGGNVLKNVDSNGSNGNENRSFDHPSVTVISENTQQDYSDSKFSNIDFLQDDINHTDMNSPKDRLLLEPDAKTLLNGVLEMLVQAIMKRTIREHRLSEHAARMNAMDSANSNAGDMIRRLQIKYNRLRQDRITKEIIEIIAGSEMNTDA